MGLIQEGPQSPISQALTEGFPDLEAGRPLISHTVTLEAALELFAQVQDNSDNPPENNPQDTDLNT